MTRLIDIALLKSGMPHHELCALGRRRRVFYYYGTLGMAAVAMTFSVLIVAG